MKRILSSCVLSICIFGVISAHAADEQKQRKLAECNFEAEKVLVLYEAIYEGGRLGKIDDDYAEMIMQQQSAAMNAKNAKELKRAEELQKELDHKRNQREEEVRVRLLDKCMQINGLSYDPSAASCREKYIDSMPFRYLDKAADCWR